MASLQVQPFGDHLPPKMSDIIQEPKAYRIVILNINPSYSRM
ncbi:hypothetical protein [Paenibacillus agricola]|nr:hypothetical protein [Paenibacillus agricola]